MDAIEDARRRAAEVLRAAAHGRRDAERALRERSGDLSRVVLAAVEGLETLSDTVAGLQGELPPAVRDAASLSARAAWERLEASGIRLDGRIGEKIDLARHRVVKAVAAPGREPGTVASVIAPGVIFQGQRIRDAAVCVVASVGGK